ncbi:heavy metal transporter [Streptomyces sp. PSKA28]|uniref:Heavy metal transporter n=1 Tax=Streptomyces himalayensis subsp. himalayensis TaxID=2756131 RepID=A0A7W0DFW7_9ACTN|nr:heavy metal transporter [Streptomyces himalayensis]MBA2944351.1 heavy metal transporter [Streptomyces himalayensis subsp. himalayensis]
MAVATLLALTAYLIVQYLYGDRGAPRCEVVAGDGDGASYELTPEQAVNAATISAVGTSRGMPERAVTIALATALQESALRNISHGDRDSLGLFQQRPSQGWGTPKEIMDPAYSAGEFYEHLAKVPGYSRLPLTVAAQRVQRSGYPQAYAKHEPDATLLAAALTGRAAASLTCTTRPATEAADPSRVRTALVRDFGTDVLQDSAATVSDEAAASPSASPSARESGTVVVPVASTASTAGGAAQRRGWELAHWAVANASALGIDQVSYAGRVWTAEDSEDGWRTEDSAGGSAVGDTSDGAGQRSAGSGGKPVDEVRIACGQ